MTTSLIHGVKYSSCYGNIWLLWHNIITTGGINNIMSINLSTLILVIIITNTCVKKTSLKLCKVIQSFFPTLRRKCLWFKYRACTLARPHPPSVHHKLSCKFHGSYFRGSRCIRENNEILHHMKISHSWYECENKIFMWIPQNGPLEQYDFAF